MPGELLCLLVPYCFVALTGLGLVSFKYLIFYDRKEEKRREKELRDRVLGAVAVEFSDRKLAWYSIPIYGLGQVAVNIVWPVLAPLALLKLIKNILLDIGDWLVQKS